jgi:hypothetical protein
MSPAAQMDSELVGASAVAAFSNEWLDRLIALFSQDGCASRGICQIDVHTRSASAASRDRHRCPWDCELLWPRALPRLQTCALVCDLSPIVAEITKARLKLG